MPVILPIAKLKSTIKQERCGPLLQVTCAFLPFFLIIACRHSWIHSDSICSFFISLSSCLIYYSIFALFFSSKHVFSSRKEKQNNKNQNIQKNSNPQISNWTNHFSKINQCSFSQSYGFLKYCEVHCTREVPVLLRKWSASLNFPSTY